MTYMDPRPEGLNTEKAPESIVETLTMSDNKTVTFDACQWQLVPVDPTVEMLTAIAETDQPPSSRYRNMLDVAPTLVANVGEDELNSLAGQLNASNERNGKLRQALQACSAELFAQCGDQPQAMLYVDEARSALNMTGYEGTTPTPGAQSAGQEAVVIGHVYPEGGRLRFADKSDTVAKHMMPLMRPVCYADAAPVNGGELHPDHVLVSKKLLLKAMQAINWHLEPGSPDEHEAVFKRLVEIVGMSPVNGGEREATPLDNIAGTVQYEQKHAALRVADAQQVGGDARAEEVAALAPILRGIIEGGSYDDPAELYADDFEAPDGDVFVRRAADLLEEYAALTSPAKEQK